MRMHAPHLTGLISNTLQRKRPHNDTHTSAERATSVYLGVRRAHELRRADASKRACPLCRSVKYQATEYLRKAASVPETQPLSQQRKARERGLADRAAAAADTRESRGLFLLNVSAAQQLAQRKRGRTCLAAKPPLRCRRQDTFGTFALCPFFLFFFF